MLHEFDVHELPNERGGWTAQTVSYAYHVRERSGAELVRFEWHPVRHQIRYPHLHIHGQAGNVRIEAKQHVPTGFVELAMVVRFLIEELGISPLRADWRRIVGGEEGQTDG